MEHTIATGGMIFKQLDHTRSQKDYLYCTVNENGTYSCSLGVNNEPPSDQKNTFALEWSRFGQYIT